MKHTGAALVVRALEDEGIPFAFGIPGTHNLELYDALRASKVRSILVTDEQSAGFMADGLWRASGRLGCVNVVPGAGLTHALSGIAEAWLDAIPMLVLACGVRRDTGRAYQLHDIDQAALARPVTKSVLQPSRGEELYATVRAACRLAREGRPGPVMVEVPAELYLFRHDHGPAAPAAPRAADPGAELGPSLAPAVDLLQRARRPLLYAGLGAAAAGEGLVALAERLESPVATTFQGKGVFPESHPLFLWPGYGASAPEFVRRVAERCDATLAIGCRFGEVATGSYGAPPPGPLVHVDIDAEVFSRNYPARVAVAADARDAVPALLAALSPRAPDAALRESIRQGHEGLRREWESRAGKAGVAPARLLRGLQERFGPRTVFTTDSGNGTFLAAEMLRLDAPGRFLAPVDYSCMGYAIPAAVGAALVANGAPVVALPGDGAFLMTGLELMTAAALGLPVVVVALRDGELGQIAQFQRSAYGREECSGLPDYDLAAICAGLGVECRSVASDDALAEGLGFAADAVARRRPAVLDVAVDYSVGTHFTRGVVRTNFARLPWADRLRFASRAIARRAVAAVS